MEMASEVRCKLAGLIRLQSFDLSLDHIHLETPTLRTSTAARIMDQDHTRPFYILLSNFTNSLIHIPKHQRVAVATSLYYTLINVLLDEVPALLADETLIEHGTIPLVEYDNAGW